MHSRFSKNISLIMGGALCIMTAPLRLCADTARTISKTQWQHLTNDKAFYYRNKTEQPFHIQTHNNGFLVFLYRILSFFASPTGHIILWGLFIGVAVYVAYRVLRDRNILFIRKGRKYATHGASTEEDITATDWETQLQKAINEKNVRMAIRSSYMMLLQMLQERQFIQYRQDKTNYDYYRELADTWYSQPFKKLLRSYEYAWYGDLPLTHEAYEEYMRTFTSVKEKLKTS